MSVALCTPKSLPPILNVTAARTAISCNPLNAPPVQGLAALAPDLIMTPGHLALLTTKYWGQGGVRLTVGFMEQISAELRNRLLSHMNAWADYCNVQFVWTGTDPQVRISRGGGGYWSYLGTDVLHIPRNQQTMNLEGFTMSTPDSEFHRVVRHETGHTLGFPHEHMRRQLVARIDRQKAIAYFERTQGWSQQEVIQQVLTPLEDSSIMATEAADQLSIMCYQLPGSITVDGQPIPGGNDIDPTDQAFAAKVYPKPDAPQPPVKPPPIVPPVPPTPPVGGYMHTYDFQLSDVTTIVSPVATLGLRLNCLFWLGGYAAQLTFPPGAAHVATALPPPLSDNDARECLVKLAAHQGDIHTLALPWGQLLAWLTEILGQLIRPKTQQKALLRLTPVA